MPGLEALNIFTNVEMCLQVLSENYNYFQNQKSFFRKSVKQQVLEMASDLGMQTHIHQATWLQVCHEIFQIPFKKSSNLNPASILNQGIF